MPGNFPDKILHSDLTVKSDAVQNWNIRSSLTCEIDHVVAVLALFDFWQADRVGEEGFNSFILVVAFKTFCNCLSLS